jgi:hypothetical protein
MEIIMIRYLKNYSWAIFIGAALGIFADLSISDPGWWYITIPLCVLIGIRD